MLMPTANPHADYERWADQAEATALSVEAADNAKHAEVRAEVREAILAGAFTRVTHVSIAGKPEQVCVSEVWDDRMYDCNGDLFRLLRAVIERRDIDALVIANGMVQMCATRHADDVCERLDLAGEVMA